jgi:hypothetical protein
MAESYDKGAINTDALLEGSVYLLRKYKWIRKLQAKQSRTKVQVMGAKRLKSRYAAKSAPSHLLTT